MRLRRKATWAAALLMTIGCSAAYGADASLSSARDLYAAAAYEDALSMLDELRAGKLQAEEARTVEQYRAFCLLALGRSSDAEQAIAAVVLAAPGFQPADGEVSPRVRSAFSDVRRRMLPTIIQDRYASAKSAYDQKNFADAVSGFKLVLDVMSDAAVAGVVKQPPLSDLKMLAAGFYDLSTAAAAPPPPPPPPPSPPPPPAAPEPAPEPVAAPLVPRIYGPDDLNVRPPVVLRQVLPPFPGQITIAAQGVIEVIIDEVGNVERATMRVPLNPRYDRIAEEAARGWKYRPALADGMPVRYRKLVQVSLTR